MTSKQKPSAVERVGVDLDTTEGRAHWLSLRQRDVTASVAGTLLGEHPYITPYELYRMKSDPGSLPDPEESGAMRRGRHLEPVAINLLGEGHPDLTIIPAKQYLRDPSIRLGATPDAMAFCPKRGNGIIQIKSVEPSIFRKVWKEEDGSITPPLWIVIQANVEAHLAGADWAAVAPLVVGFGIDVHLIEIPIHKGTIGAVRAKTMEFWERVEQGRPYDPHYSRDLKALEAAAIAAGDGPSIDLGTDNMLPGLLDEDSELQQRIKVDGERRKAIKGEILAKLGGASSATIADGRRIKASIVRRGEYVVMPSKHVRISVA